MVVFTRRSSVHRNTSLDRKMSAESSSQPSPIRRPLSGPPSILNVFTMMILHLCKKILFLQTKMRILIYVMTLFVVSSMFDLAVRRPKMIFPELNYFLNAYFVKLGWFWTLTIITPFILMTSYTYCCGRLYLIFRHLARLLIATINWFCWVQFFVYYEGRHRGFDLSGHAFLLIFSNLLLIDEARAILGWEDIHDQIRDEQHARDHQLNEFGQLRNLNEDDFNLMRKTYEKYLPFVRLNFVLITCLSLMWDFMLFNTIIFFHSMPEKLASGVIAICSWAITYRYFYKIDSNYVPSPGEGGVFVYQSSATKSRT